MYGTLTTYILMMEVSYLLDYFTKTYQFQLVSSVESLSSVALESLSSVEKR